MAAKTAEKTKRSVGGHPTNERAAEIAGAVVAATMQAFAESGADFSMDEVAALAGVSKQAIYRRWKSKTDLIIETIDSVLADGFAVPDVTHSDSVMELRETAWHLFDTDLSVAHRVNIFLQAEALREERISSRLLEWRGRFLAVYRHGLRAIEHDSRRENGDISLQAEILMELLSGASSMLAITGAVSDEDKRRAFDERWVSFCRIAIR